MLGIVIPTIAGREDSLRRCLDAYTATSADFPGGIHLQIVSDAPTCGMAWDVGAAALPTVTHLALAADDLEPLPGWWQPLHEAADQGCCPTALVLNPDGSLQSAGMSDGVFHTEIPPDWTPVEHTLTPFMTWQQWETVRPMPHDLHYCTDWWVSARLNKDFLPIRIQRRNSAVVRTGSRIVHHDHPVGRGAGMNIHERNRHDRALFHRHIAESLAPV